MKIDAGEEQLCCFMVWTLTSLNTSWNFRKSTFSENHMHQANSLQNDDRDARPGPKWSSNNTVHTSNTAEAHDLNKSWAFSVQRRRWPQTSWPQDVVKLPTVGVLLFGLTLYESRVIWTAAPRGNEIRASEEILWFFVVWTLTSLNIHELFKNEHFRQPCKF